MTKGVARRVIAPVPVVSQLDGGGLRFGRIADESQGKPAFGKITPPQQLHPQTPDIEVQGAVEVADTEHGVQ